MSVPASGGRVSEPTPAGAAMPAGWLGPFGVAARPHSVVMFEPMFLRLDHSPERCTTSSKCGRLGRRSLIHAHVLLHWWADPRQPRRVLPPARCGGRSTGGVVPLFPQPPRPKGG